MLVESLQNRSLGDKGHVKGLTSNANKVLQASSEAVFARVTMTHGGIFCYFSYLWPSTVYGQMLVNTC